MKVSVIVPVYNSEKYLDRCLYSITNQSYKDIEVIVCDDASTDKCKDIIKRHAKADNRIIDLYLKENKGVSAARNACLAHFSGDYVLFVDSDDMLLPDAIKTLVDASIKYKSDYVDSYELFASKTKLGDYVTFTERKMPKKTLVLGSLDNHIEILDMNAYVKGKLISKEIVKGLKFDEYLNRYEDIVFEHQMKIRIKNYVLLDTVVYVYFQVPNSLDNTTGLKHMCYYDAAKEVMDVYKDSSFAIKNRMSAVLINNMYFITMSKVIKNGLPLNENARVTYNYLSQIKTLFPNYYGNRLVSKFVKKRIKKMTLKSIKNDIKMVRKINFIKYYFQFLTRQNHYVISQDLLK